jgi:hypothetical protein
MARVPGGDNEARGAGPAPAASPRPGRGARRRKNTKGVAAGALAVAGVLAAGGLLAASPPVRAASRHAHTPLRATAQLTAAGTTFNLKWSRQFASAAVFAQGSPIADVIAGVPAAIVGALNGEVYAVSLATDANIAGWPHADPGAVPIQSTPSVSGKTVYIGTGDAGHPASGGYLAMHAGGGQLWYRTVSATPGSAATSGVQAGLTVGRLQGTTAVVGGSLGQYEDELNATTGAVMPGFAWFAADSEFSTPSIADLYGDGRHFIVEGGESTAGDAYGEHYTSGGHVRVLLAAGHLGQTEPNGGLECQYNTTQGVESSPAVGGLLTGGATGIVVGTGNTYKTASDSNKLIALGPDCGLKWKATLDGSTLDSPALVDARGNGFLQIAEGTSTGSNSGTAYLINGANGATIWSHGVSGQVIGGITSADLGGGYEDLLVPTTAGLYVLDGKTGNQIALLGNGSIALQSSALVNDDPNGTVGITVAGYDASGGRIMHWEVAGSPGNRTTEVGAWPMFHHDPQLSGTTLPS